MYPHMQKRFNNIQTAPMSKLTCDVFSEIVPYSGANSVFLDQMFPHFCDSICFYQNCAVSDKNVYFRCS